MRRPHVIIERNPRALTSLLPEIQALADSEKDALGFLPAKAFEDAIGRGRLLAAIIDDRGSHSFAGYLLHSGVFPNAKVQQIAAIRASRKAGVASTLLKALVSELERVGFMSIRADVASDLASALAFYTKNGFEAVRERAGGKTRGRKIVIHSRQLDTDNLFSIAAPQAAPLGELGIRHRNPGEVPVFAFDLNVYFDLVKQRDQSEYARRLFGEALGHTIRLAIADEFVAELRRTSNTPSADPVLQMALQLPRLPKPDASALDPVADRIHDIVFVQRNAKGAGTEQAKSDARHLAHAAISRAAAFITRDGPILNARNELLPTFGIDIATVEEVLDLLPESLGSTAVALHGEGFELGPIADAQLSEYLAEVDVPAPILSEFTKLESSAEFVQREAIRCGGRIVATGVVQVPKGVEPIARMIVHVRHEHHDAELFADHLLGALIHTSSKSAPIAIELIHLPGQSIVNKLAAARGFQRRGNSPTFSKIAVGRPCSASTWPAVVQQVRRRTGLVLPDTLPSGPAGCDIDIQTATGITARINAGILEDLIGPTLLVWPGRDGVIVPITRAYADELLGTAVQPNLAFIANRDAAFLSLRGYVNSPRAAKKMRVGAPIIFYESKGKGRGRGAAVAVARIVNSIVVSKQQLDPKSDKRLVIDSANGFSKTEDVLLTTFDNLMAFPTPVAFDLLKHFDAVGATNLVSAVSLSSEKIDSILTFGWSSGKIQ
ncbi:GNAT family N-acetyltransferase [Rhizobium lentis]|uniref:GNAT family N-acetyltransferase n=1 Tax=Rhizobium lentis TaxID=1138194 RepID=UPI001C832807|nr:GNAT family N-acetyltransferase [Rhizobium lentis]MBX4959524.1 GNAT family N-acetyltransferase [Rhizobium lentis]MBX5032609.1 GNAT family N-acetyltransferase [Rhizobium lentis]